MRNRPRCGGMNVGEAVKMLGAAAPRDEVESGLQRNREEAGAGAFSLSGLLAGRSNGAKLLASWWTGSRAQGHRSKRDTLSDPLQAGLTT